MKLDLDDLERAALDSPAGLCFQEGQRLEAGAPTCTAITLALIAHIRELKDALRLQCDRLDMFHENYTKVAKDPLNVREILDKGVVLP